MLTQHVGICHPPRVSDRHAEPLDARVWAPALTSPQLTCNFEGALGRVCDGGRDSHGRCLALLQGARVAQADGLLQLPDSACVVTALRPLPPPLGAPGLHLQAAAVVLQLPGGLVLRLAQPAQPALGQGALLRVCAQLQKPARGAGVRGWGARLSGPEPCSSQSLQSTPGPHPHSRVPPRSLSFSTCVTHIGVGTKCRHCSPGQ